jgi:hypothetical protein
MATPTTIRPDDARTAAYREFVAIVRAYLLPRGVTPIWDSLGRPGEDGELPASARGAIRFRPSSPEWEVVCAAGERPPKRGIACPVDIEIETRVAGSNWANSANLLGLIEAALGAGRVADERGNIRSRLRAVGVTDWEFLEAPTTAEPEGTAKGKLRLHLGKTI